MNMIKCEECGKEISKLAKQCPHCGMKIYAKVFCSECGEEVPRKGKMCSKCGAPVKKTFNISGIFDTIAERVNLKLALIGGGAVLLVVLLSVLLLPKFFKPDYIEVYEQLNKAEALISVYASDLYSAWHYGIYDSDEVTKSGLALETSLSSSDFDNYYCSMMLYSEDWNDVVNCLRSAHGDLGNYQDVKDILNSVKDQLKKYENNDEEFEELEDYYKNLNEFLNLAEDYYGTFNQLAVDIKDIRNNISENKEELDYLLDYSSNEYSDYDSY